MNLSLPALSPVVEPQFRTYFKVKPEVASDPRFKALVPETVKDWLPAKEKMPLLQWWEVLKADVRLAAKRVTKEKKNERKEELNFLLTLQAYLAAKVSAGDLQSLSDLHQAQERISNWFSSRAREVLLHASIKEVADSENTLIFHHEQLNKSRKRSSILKLINQEGNLVEGHKNCASVLQEEARALLDNPSILDSKAQEELLSLSLIHI